MKVLQVPRRFVRREWGGMETVILELTKRLPGLGIETAVSCTNALADTDEESIEGVQVRRFPYVYPYFGLSPEAVERLDHLGGNCYSRGLLQHLREEPAVDLLHLHSGRYLNGICHHVARQRGIPYIVTVHGGFLDAPPAEADAWTDPTRGKLEWGRALGWWYGSRHVFDDAAAILCVDYEDTAKMAARFPGKRVLHQPNGVDSQRFVQGNRERFRTQLGLDPATKLLLNVSRIDHQKNQWLAVDILARLLGEGKPVHLVLVGPITNPPYHDRLQAAIQTQGLTGHVTVIPGLPPGDPALADAYQAADLFLLTSLHEPFGIVLLEAWAAGCPVVTTAVGGIPHFTQDGEDVLHFASGDAATGANLVWRVLSNPRLAETLVAKGRAKALDTYSWDRIAGQLASLYQDVCAEGRVPQR